MLATSLSLDRPICEVRDADLERDLVLGPTYSSDSELGRDMLRLSFLEKALLTLSLSCPYLGMLYLIITPPSTAGRFGDFLS